MKGQPTSTTSKSSASSELLLMASSSELTMGLYRYDWQPRLLVAIFGVRTAVIRTVCRADQRFEAQRAESSPDEAPAASPALKRIQHDTARPARIDTVRGDVHHQAQTRQRRASVKPADQIRWQRDRFQTSPPAPVRRMQIKRLAFRDDDFVAHDAIQRGADFVFRPAEVDKRCRMTR